EPGLDEGERAPAQARQPRPAEAGNGAANATPVAARIADSNGLDVTGIEGTGPRGKVTKADVLAALESDGGGATPEVAPAPPKEPPKARPKPLSGEATAKPIRGPAATLARFMEQSRGIPTATSFRTLEVDTLDARRRALKDAGKKLSFTHVIAWAIVRAAREMPVMAHSFEERDGKPFRIDPGVVSLGLAVDVERPDGSRSLVVPVVEQADTLDFPSFVARYDELVGGARENTLPPDAYTGANITLTNPGGIGTVASVPRLMPGQGTIVATGAIGLPPGLRTADPVKVREIGVAKVMTMTSTYDHRVIQGAESGAFLRRIDQLLQGEDGFYDEIFDALGLAEAERAPAAKLPETFADALPHLQDTYCGTIAYEIEHISDHKQRVWLRQVIESGDHRWPPGAELRRRLLQRLSQVEALETYLHKAFLGRKQFSIEGVDVLVPMLDETVELAADAGAREVVIGMAHRARLNVIAHTVGRRYQSILVEFEGEQNLEADTAMPSGGTGDVKYHYGAFGTYKTPDGRTVKVTLSPNPSHLEYIDPVVEGRARADQSTRDSRELSHDPTLVLPVLIHGDAAFPAQGIVAETLNLQALPGYATGGTIHIITDNQLGFTTDPEEGRSTRYASDLAKGFDVPIVHVNADDVEGCIAAVRLSMAYRARFGRDVLIDLIGYRRFGHNEQDEPAYTQPVMYERIKKHPPVRKLYAD